MLSEFNNLGRLYNDQGRIGEADDMLKRGLQCYEREFGKPALKAFTSASRYLESTTTKFQTVKDMPNCPKRFPVCHWNQTSG